MRSRINIRSPRETLARYTHGDYQPHAVADDTVLGRELFRGVVKCAVRLESPRGNYGVGFELRCPIIQGKARRPGHETSAWALDPLTPGGRASEVRCHSALPIYSAFAGKTKKSRNRSNNFLTIQVSYVLLMPIWLISGVEKCISRHICLLVTTPYRVKISW